MIGGLLAVFLGWQISIHTKIPFDGKKWKMCRQVQRYDMRFRMTDNLLQKNLFKISRIQALELLGEMDRGNNNFMQYNLGQHHRFLGLMSDTYWLSLGFENDLLVNIRVHPD